MAKITRITTQRRNKHRYNIYIDKGKGEDYGFSVDEDILVEHHLHKGLELTDEMINTLMEQDDLHKVYNQVINYLSYRMRTKKEIRDYLLKKDVVEEQIEEIIAKLIDRGLVNDHEFAEMFVRSRMRTSAKGPGLIRQELNQKGISADIANEVLEKFELDDQIEKALDLVQKRLNRSSNHSFRRQIDQARAALMRNGYRSEVIRAVIEQVEDGKDADEEWQALKHHGERLHRRHEGKFPEHELRQRIKEGLYRQGFSLGLIDEYLQSR